MGCIASKPADVYEADQKNSASHSKGDAHRKAAEGPDPIPPQVAQAIQQASQAAAAAAQAEQQESERSIGHVILGTPRHSLTAGQLVARANSRAGNYKKNSVGADLHSIMDDQGMLNPMVARQMSVMSHYSVRSESGSVLITPEQRLQAEFKLIKLIGRGGFGNVYLGEWDGERVAIKIIQVRHMAALDQPFGHGHRHQGCPCGDTYDSQVTYLHSAGAFGSRAVRAGLDTCAGAQQRRPRRAGVGGSQGAHGADGGGADERHCTRQHCADTQGKAGGHRGPVQERCRG